MAYGELYLPPYPPKRNHVTGRFMKGHEPANKGKKWSEYMGKRAQKLAAKGWKNLELHRNKNGRPDTAARCRKKVIAVMNDGTWIDFDDIGSAGKWIDGSRENVGRCCRMNQACHKNLKTGKVNTDHKYKGVRFYFDGDNIWATKIKS